MEKKQQKKSNQNDYFVIFEYSILRNPLLSVGSKYLYALIKSYINSKTQECFVSNKTLMKASGLSEKTLIKYVDELVKNNILIKIHQTGGCCRYKLINLSSTIDDMRNRCFNDSIYEKDCQGEFFASASGVPEAEAFQTEILEILTNFFKSDNSRGFKTKYKNFTENEILEVKYIYENDKKYYLEKLEKGISRSINQNQIEGKRIHNFEKYVIASTLIFIHQQI